VSERFFRLVNFDKYQNFRGKRAHWMKLSLDFFDDPVIVGLPDSQRLAFIGVLILCAKRANRVPFDATYIKKRCSLRVTPDLELFMSHGLIEFTKAESGAEAFPRVEESRGEERREEPPQPPAAAVGPVVEPPAGLVSPPPPTFGVLLDEARCPGCENRATVRMAANGRGYFCGTKLGGCGQNFDILEPAILDQLTERAREAILRRAAPPPPRPVPTSQDRTPTPEETALFDKRHKLADEFVAWYQANPDAGSFEGRPMWGAAFGLWPRGKELPLWVSSAVFKVATALLTAAAPHPPKVTGAILRKGTKEPLCDVCSSPASDARHGAA